MKTIPLTKGYSAIVDDEDYELLSQWKWQAHVRELTVYARRFSRDETGKEQHVWMHRVVNGTPVGMSTDHVNGNGLDNRRNNLRSATHFQNMWNKRPQRGHTSKFTGVSWEKSRGKWAANITVNKTTIFLGRYRAEEDAAEAYEKKAAEVRGAFHREAQ